ncbi:MAG: hypothetical protein K9G40_05880, partial [Crocinitomicaceae bacterium]|nr:hypothetical protein [Crocinitomicaceae bacterium]
MSVGVISVIKWSRFGCRVESFRLSSGVVSVVERSRDTERSKKIPTLQLGFINQKDLFPTISKYTPLRSFQCDSQYSKYPLF